MSEEIERKCENCTNKNERPSCYNHKDNSLVYELYSTPRVLVANSKIKIEVVK